MWDHTAHPQPSQELTFAAKLMLILCTMLLPKAERKEKGREQTLKGPSHRHGVYAGHFTQSMLTGALKADLIILTSQMRMRMRNCALAGWLS